MQKLKLGIFFLVKTKVYLFLCVFGIPESIKILLTAKKDIDQCYQCHLKVVCLWHLEKNM